MRCNLFTTPFVRPAHLSDPGDDHAGALHILPKRDEELGWGEFAALFDPLLPAATYEEAAYFLPWAIDYLRRNPEDASQLAEHLAAFISVNAGWLRQDGMLDPARAEIRRCLHEWTNSFIVRAIEHHGRTSFTVENGEAVRELIARLDQFETNVDLGIEFVQSLADQSDSPIKSAWLLEYCRLVYQQMFDPAPQAAAIRAILTDREMLTNHAIRLLDSSLAAKIPTSAMDELFADVYL